LSTIVNDRFNAASLQVWSGGMASLAWPCSKVQPPCSRKREHATRRHRQLLTRGLVVFCALWLIAVPARADDQRQAAVRMAKEYSAKLEELAAWCDSKGLSAQAATTRQRAKPPGPSVIRVLALPVDVGQASALPADASPDVAEWHKRFWRLRRDQSKAWFLLARKAIQAGGASLAFDLVHAAVAEDPDHEAVRRLLGYQEFRGQWRTPYEVGRLRSGHVWSDRFGWIRKADLPRYEKGERFYQGRWTTAEEDARAHADIQSGWDLETEHYAIRTNDSIEAGVRLGRKLEELYDVWGQLFVSYYASRQQIVAMFNRRGSLAELPRHKVVFFHDRQQYNEGLRDAMPGIEKSIGVYMSGMRRAYFFGGSDYDERTMFHEATHQLFHESRPVPHQVGESANCWIVEGIAVFMESLRKEGDYYVVGGANDPRMRAARYRLLASKFYVPFEQLTRYGLPQLQADPKVATLYSQIAGCTNFLLYYDQGRYRDAMVNYLVAVYEGSQDPTLLSRLTGESYETLDRQYREFMTTEPRP
jgi:hypothetical protein